MSEYEVLHLTPHLGGGVGTVVMGHLDYESNTSSVRHTLVALDDLNPESKQLLSGLNIEWQERAFWDIEALDSLVERADILLIHWWNHPLLQSLLMNHSFPEARILIWCHISGTPSPNNFTKFIIEYPDKLIFTTPLSYLAPEIQSLTDEKRRKIGWIWSTAGVERLEKYKDSRSSIQTKEKNIVGYVGNLDYTKLSSEFLDACVEMNDMGAEFVVIGPLTKQFKEDSEKLSQNVNINITGYISEEEKFKRMKEFKVFGYPLARRHYATCDQAIQEAMALGAVPVVLNNPMESYMVEHGRTGLIAKNMQEYVAHIRLLLKDSDLRMSLSSNSEKYASDEYSIVKMAKKWAAEYTNILEMPKKSRPSLGEIYDKELLPHEVFIESLGNHAGVFLAHKNAVTEQERKRAVAQISCLQALQNWSSPTKSTASHYSSFFKDDQWLSEWSQLTLSTNA